MKIKFQELDYIVEFEKISSSRQILFSASICERLVPNYYICARESNWNDSPLLRTVLDKVWIILETRIIDNIQLDRLSIDCDNAIPDEQDNSSAYVAETQNATIAVCDLIIPLQSEKWQKKTKICNAFKKPPPLLQNSSNGCEAPLKMEEKALSIYPKHTDNMPALISPPSKTAIDELSPARINWFRRQLSTWADSNLRDFPWRRTQEPYAIFIAENLLQKTEATTVAPIYTNFLSRYPTLESLLATDIEDISQILKPLGLLFRAERIHQSARIILEKHLGKIPDEENELLQLPGIGKYTARAILSQAFSRPSAVLDTNVARILERYFGIRGERVKSRCKILWQAAEIVAPKRKTGRWNLTLLDFGAMICKPKPDCERCPLAQKCHHFNPSHSTM
jgi:A/G-specific adenine glycosylase